MSPKSVYNALRSRDSNNYGVKFQHTDRRYWLVTFETEDLVAHTYDIVTIVSHPARVDEEVIFDELENPRELDEKRKTMFAREHPKYLQYHQEWNRKRAREQERGQLRSSSANQPGSSSAPIKIEDEDTELEDDNWYDGVN